jgi:inner membrane protein
MTSGQINESILVKLAIIGILILLLLIPTGMIRGLIKEREDRRDTAIAEVNHKWGQSQTLVGPILTIPYKSYTTSKNNRFEIVKFAHFLPYELNIDGAVTPQIRHRGIYDVVVYNSKLNFSGKFSSPDLAKMNIRPGDVIWQDAFVSLGIADVRGIQDSVELKWEDQTIKFNPNIITSDIVHSGVNAQVPLAVAIEEIKTTNNPVSSFDKVNNNQYVVEEIKNITKDYYSFAVSLNLNGSQELNFAPVGETTNVHLTSNWSTPSFDGSFLPDKYDLSDQGFDANWTILHLNRNYPQEWLGKIGKKISSSTFGVKLLIPVNEYQKNDRSVKYAALFISLTFLVFIFVELLNKKLIHPIQYLLVGLALVIYYSLLLSISEHTTFNFAYLISGIATTLLITAYSRSVFKSNKLMILQGLILVVLYLFIFVILQLQDYALLMGNIGLFVVLAIVMYLSRKIDWYSYIKTY